MFYISTSKQQLRDSIKCSAKLSSQILLWLFYYGNYGFLNEHDYLYFNIKYFRLYLFHCHEVYCYKNIGKHTGICLLYYYLNDNVASRNDKYQTVLLKNNEIKEKYKKNNCF